MGAACTSGSKKKPQLAPGLFFLGRLLASTEFEVANVSAPDEIAAGSEVFGGEPQGAVVNRIHAHAGVITPTGVSALRAGARLQAGLS